MARKGQEEIAGFMLIVAMVLVIGLIFLFFLSPKSPERTDLQLNNLLYAWISTNSGDKAVEQLVRECELGNCEELESAVSILQTAIDKSGMSNQIDGWSINITNTVSGQNYVYREFGNVNMTGNSRATALPVSDSIARLKVFYP